MQDRPERRHAKLYPGAAAPPHSLPSRPQWIVYGTGLFMADVINGKTVRCELDGTRTYDRVVGICFLGGRDIGETVITAGLARDCPRYSGGRYKNIEQPEAGSLTFPAYCQQR